MAGAKYRDWFEEIDGKTKLRPEMREVLTTWARNGLTEQEIAKNIGISRSTLHEWRKKYPDISDALKNARAYADARVENALFRKALGYDYVQTTMKTKGRGEYAEVETVKTTIHVPPDMAAIAFYLKNRLPDHYKDRWPDMKPEEEEAAGRVCVRLIDEAIKAQKKKDYDRSKKTDT